jgi:hypothetical protein
LVATVAASLPPGVIKIPTTRILNESAYGIEFEVGSPPQSNVLKVDTGSPTIGFENHRNNIWSTARRTLRPLWHL